MVCRTFHAGKSIHLNSNLCFHRNLQVKKFIEVHGINIPRKNEVKLLGITIDGKLKFDEKVDILCKNAARQLNILYRFTGIFDLKEREKIYYTFI